jgi:hypothetical protein
MLGAVLEKQRVTMKWKEYEQKALDYFKAKYPEAKIDRNLKLPGRLSGIPREIDILIDSQVYGVSLQIAIECKDWESKLDVADIGTFIDKLKDVKITKGVVLSRSGYTEAARVRARSETEVQLQVLDFDNLPSFYGFWGNPYRGHLGAIISAPNGWVIDNNTPSNLLPHMLCYLHPFEFTIAEAQCRKQWMYFQIYPVIDGIDLAKSFGDQEAKVKETDPEAKITRWEENTQQGIIYFRRIISTLKHYTEFTGGVQADDFFAYCVCQVPNDFLPDDLARLRYVMNGIRLIKLKGVDPNNSHQSWKRIVAFRK